MMDLFNSDTIPNILPEDGEVNYYGPILNTKKSQEYFEQLFKNIQWENDKYDVLDSSFTNFKKLDSTNE